MKIYIGAKFDALERIRGHRDDLRKLGHQVTSSWLDEHPRPAFMDVEQFMSKVADQDIQDVLKSDCIIVDTIDVSERGGRETELGVALVSLKLIVVVGPLRTVFHHKADLHLENWGDLLQYFHTYYNEGAVTAEKMIAAVGNDGQKFVEVGNVS